MSRIVLPPADPPGPEWWPRRRRYYSLTSAAVPVPPAEVLQFARMTSTGVFTLTLVLVLLGYDLAATATFVAAITAASTAAYVRVAGLPLGRRV
ncbi:hypothetical protein [Kribbella speibonae]|uniref:Sensor histidine kinase n=1 Tax=Kribbella speibonae TaxID=1572660 RepID=A0ABY1ZWI0_9ACTN|nr:hypothetical protein [Kribbella speibonae]TCC16644.1 hypothetical protein E0H58_39955 [Kribbella speibonae]